VIIEGQEEKKKKKKSEITTSKDDENQAPTSFKETKVLKRK
jgi:hypothetical protein